MKGYRIYNPVELLIKPKAIIQANYHGMSDISFFQYKTVHEAKRDGDQLHQTVAIFKIKWKS